MDMPDTTLEISTMGRFCITVGGKPVATEWPDEMAKQLFCSLLSPLDLYFTWDRVCRCMLGVPVTATSRRLLEEVCIRPLNRFLIKKLGFNPLIAGYEHIRIDPQRIHVDSHEFHSSVVEGLRLLSHGNHAAAFEKFSRADSLYVGSYLPGISGKIITNTRRELEYLYRTAVTGAMPLIRNSGCSGSRMKESDCECDHKE